MATVRIYKVAELLGMSSPDAMALLKKETGIEVKSASSSIEEIVARQFVERQAKARRITLPGGPLFADTTTAPAKKTPAKGAKAPEPAKPAAPVLRPRLVKTVKPAAPVEERPAEQPGVEPPQPVHEPVPEPAVEIEEPPPPPIRSPRSNRGRPRRLPWTRAYPPAAPH